MTPRIHLHPEVAQQLQQGGPVVALESTIIAHGMPYPQNVQTAREVEAIVRENGAVPATIAILDGKIQVGLDQRQLESLGNTPGVWKVSLRDLPFVVSEKLNGATTVAATMHIAHLAGIRVFVTGGIGGVHRGAETSMDISADLTEMGRTSVAVVAAGVKSILDIGLTLEYLETLGVPVVTFGSEEFPSFYSRGSGFQSPLRLDSPDAIARFLRAKWDLELNGSALIANPIPSEQEFPFAEMEQHIRAALDAAERQSIRGKSTTPFLLKYIADATGGDSLASNIALVKNNAALGARIATAFSSL
ncbi:MAG: pseudouridine-5'-phosphate glycosidase [Bacteroidota bacterium]|jgi:pseudouridine-5'-phosphate glycosidase|uniref:pseudouridine-5'-phosphate glycosidase n=1 Tax=Candidatus Pollutiaquabacter sp. TaxID=3416354 RepID=UPI001B46CBD6|nr:pseudouridine-5'-phosphate glycosidase [Bacteroidota bacterium]MBP7268714.1 pseudouridine-5'-phosphate glycosidase [Bacteroidia bacterium]MBP7438365.1 pseudouridine-5'-phosphate glycosidase [Bacteroidia bacterium]MBP7728046.1 pseudouridine-5'-phosphate glycosidase [Bacteroidia bacterium]MBP7771227.1 pseudouridine-5'-phosphate glycosidase [Bacteroidia bacterium]